jgi:hypothetical protein
MNLQEALKKCTESGGASVSNGAGRVVRRATKEEAHLHPWIDDATGEAANVPTDEAVSSDWTVTPRSSARPHHVPPPVPPHETTSRRPPYDPEAEAEALRRKQSR